MQRDFLNLADKGTSGILLTRNEIHFCLTDFGGTGSGMLDLSVIILNRSCIFFPIKNMFISNQIKQYCVLCWNHLIDFFRAGGVMK